ncbi:hypothetical protein ACTI_25370 [Actinoplanes sp. OR16]|uniref:hypothetical protein n=1 Tax=Actinoplanes sp. OR16 TaxID=946334 RepID=UPI000F6C96C1|nr:hypothetical protein [Actinoplanes sp. OR16]BBH65852.1 hypothetical protein ACTI_25370 [Actinoplanes sp. OR16]
MTKHDPYAPGRPSGAYPRAPHGEPATWPTEVPDPNSVPADWSPTASFSPSAGPFSPSAGSSAPETASSFPPATAGEQPGGAHAAWLASPAEPGGAHASRDDPGSVADPWAATGASAPSAWPPASAPPSSYDDPGAGWNDTTWSAAAGVAPQSPVPQPWTREVADSWNTGRPMPTRVPDAVPPSWQSAEQPTATWNVPRDLTEPSPAWQPPAPSAWVKQTPSQPNHPPAVPPMTPHGTARGTTSLPSPPTHAGPPPDHTGPLPTPAPGTPEPWSPERVEGRRAKKNPKVALVAALVAAALGGAGVGAGVTAALSDDSSASAPGAPGAANGQPGVPGQNGQQQQDGGQAPTTQPSQGS